MEDKPENGQAGAGVAPQKSSEKTALCNPDDALDELGILFESWDNRLTIDNLALAERYLNGKLVICLALSGLGTGFVSQQYIAVLQGILRFGEFDGDGRDLDEFVLPRNLQSGFESETLIGRTYRNDGLVFIEDVEFVDFPKVAVPTLVRLQPPDEAFRGIRGSIYFSRSGGFETLRNVSDGEAASAFDLVMIGADQRTSQQVQ